MSHMPRGALSTAIAASADEGRDLRERLTRLSQLRAQRMLELETLRADIDAFSLIYRRRFGRMLSELDELEAQIAELEALRHRSSQTAQDRARQARTRARESAESYRQVAKLPEPSPFRPTDDLKALYRWLAKHLHPDHARDDTDRERRTRLMAEVNSAYREQDIARLQEIRRRLEADEAQNVPPETDVADLRRRVIALERELQAIDRELEALKASDGYRLKVLVDSAGDQEEVFGELARDLEQQIAQARHRLDELSTHRSHTR